ncbi:MAG: pilus assembly protein TadA [Deltaproteobacteria bacterium]|nr:MAG: pilus assembly protein TadA [Pseudomonadota bacterium]PIE65962.1 MAG: pilus assembly protein TadA [Deltaproteobacteria bacterium]
MPGDQVGASPQQQQPQRPQRDIGPGDRTAGPSGQPMPGLGGPGGSPPGSVPAPGPGGPPPGPPRRPPGPGRRAAVRDTLGPERVEEPGFAPPGGAEPMMNDPMGAPDPGFGPAEPAPPPPQRAPEPVAPPQREPRQPRQPRPEASPRDPRRQRVFELQKEVHDRLIEYLDLRRMDIDQLADEELWEKTENAICDIVESMDSEGRIQSFVDQDLLIKDVLNEALGLGPLEDLLADEAVDEIMVNRSDQIYIEAGGRLQATDKGFSSDKAVLGVIERIVAPLGRRIDESSPLVDARLKDGSRVNAIIPPLALRGPTLTIRKFRRDMLTAEELVRKGSLTQGMVEFMEMCVTARKNIVISGGTGSGKTTTLNIVSNFIPEGDRVLTIEDAAELQLKHDHWVQLESRPANIEGKGAIMIRDLVKNSLRMRPDRIVVGECRGGEALDMLQAMNTGHDGSLTTAHSNSPRDTLARLETMVLMAGMDLPIRAIREQIAAAIDVIIHQSRFSDGSRRITHVTEVAGMEGEVITLQDIFTFKQEGFDDQGKILGRYVPSGFVPRFYEDLQRRGIPVNMNIFRE